MAVASHIDGKDGRQPSLYALGRQGALRQGGKQITPPLWSAKGHSDPVIFERFAATGFQSRRRSTLKHQGIDYAYSSPADRKGRPKLGRPGIQVRKAEGHSWGDGTLGPLMAAGSAGLVAPMAFREPHRLLSSKPFQSSSGDYRLKGLIRHIGSINPGRMPCAEAP